MKTINRFPIFPSAGGMQVHLPRGAAPLCVSLSGHTYYLHVLHDREEAHLDTRIVVAHLDETVHELADTAVYLGSCVQSGDSRMHHFFDLGVAQGGQLIPDLPKKLCSKAKLEAGLAAPRTCERCGLGPCIGGAQ